MGRIALAVIVNGETEENWERMLRSALPHVDGLFIGYTGEGEFSQWVQTCALAREHNVKVEISAIGWDDDFAKARNENFNMVRHYNDQMLHPDDWAPEPLYDWVLWLDSDDTLEGDWDALMESVQSPEIKIVWLPYAYIYDFDNDQAMVEHPRERLIRMTEFTDGEAHWVYPIHEVILFPPGTAGARRQQAWVKHWRFKGGKHHGETLETRARNRRIVEKAIAQNPNESRMYYLYANELFAEAIALAEDGQAMDSLHARRAARKTYADFLKMRPVPDDDCYIANHRIADLYRLDSDHQSAINQDLQGLKIRPTWVESWIGIAESFFSVGEFGLARDFAIAATKVAYKPDTVQVHESATLEFTPYMIEAMANRMLGERDAALVAVEKALKYDPYDDNAIRLKKTIEEMGNTTDLRTEVRARAGTRRDKSIAFVTNPIFEPWHPRLSEEQGSGGAEQCIIEVANRFNADGWRVAVYGTPGDHKGVDTNGIEWWDTADYLPADPFTVVVGSRLPPLFDAPITADLKLLWMHDVNTGPTATPTGDPIKKPDVVLGLTDWHAEHLRRVYGVRNVAVVPNGFDPQIFAAGTGTRQKAKFVYASSPDRGLDIVLSVWGRIRDMWKDAELHVYYGWTGIDKIIALAPASANGAGLAQFKAHCTQMIDEYGGESAGIFMHNRHPRQVLAQAYAEIDAWLYPTAFCETFCITALEMQASGVLPVTTRLAGLRETVASDHYTVDALTQNIPGKEAWLARLQSIVDTDEAVKDMWREANRGHALRYTWDNAYAVWQDLIASRIGAKAA